MDPTASYNYHRKSTDDAKSVHSTRTTRQPLFKRPTMNPFSSGTSPTPPPLLSDNEVAADPLEAAVSPTTQFFEQPQNRHMFLEQPPNGNGRISTMPVDSKERKNSKPFGHRLRSVLSNAHLSGRKDSSRRTSPEMANYDTHSLSQTLHPDYRRPSYASQTTQSSTGSRRSHTEISSTDSPMYGSTSLPQSLDPSELSLITNLPPASATALDSQIYATANNSNTTNGTSRLTPVSYPDPEQVFDTRSMYQEQQNARAMQDFYEMHEPQSRADSISSSFSDAKPKKNKSLFNLLRRRESSTDLVSEKTSSNSLYKGLKHKASESFLPLRHASQSSQFSKAPTTSSKLHFPHHKSSLAYEKEAYPSSNTSGTTSPKPQVRQRSKSSSYQPSNPPTKPLPPVPNVPQLDNIPNDMLNDFRSSRMFSLDTDLGKMQGIVQQADQPNPNEAKRRPTSSQSLDLAKQLKPLTPLTTNNANPIDTYQVKKELPIAMGQAVTRAPQVPPPNSTSKWSAPESWGVKENNSTPPPAWGDGFDQEMTIRRNNTSQFYCLRVFREDGTFSTLSCAIGITVDELKEKIATKFFISRTANGTVQGYELTARTGGLTRILGSQEKPLMYQKMLLEFMGYTDNDRLQDVGREDLSYLCRFEFRRSAMKSFTPEEEALMTRDFVHVNLQRMSLQTIPIVFYQHTSEIELLDVSKNPSIALPLDFIQSCINLRQVRFSDNQARKFPSNIDRATKLAKLDLSNNLILEIDHVDFAHFPHLRSLDLQGNRLKSVAPSIAIAQLRHLNLSSNNLTQLPDEICTMITLIDLDLSFNHISQLPVRIGDLVNLERLLMTNNDLTLKLPDSFSELRSLRELDVRYNKLQNIDILSHLPKLEVLYCTKNQVYSFDDSFYRLKLFYFDRNPITRVAFKELQLSLAVLNLSKAKLAAIPENFLEKIPTVEKLVLDKNHLVSLPPQIGLLKKLVSLSIVSNKLSNLPAEIGQLQELQFLDLHSNNLKSLPDEIWSLTSLSVLNASSNLLDNFPRPTLHMSSVSSGNSGLYRNAIDSNYEMHVNDKRRQSQFSNASGLSPKDMVSSRRGSGYPPSQLSSTTTTPGTPSPMHRGASVAEGMFQHQQQQQPNRPRGLSHCLLVLSLADNRLQDECFNPISHLTSLRILNLSYNDLLEVPSGALGMLPQLTELYLSGNGLSGLPSDDFESNQSLRVFHANGNKLHSLPAELGKMPHLSVLDVGSNNLRYNINNWPYDWNWNWNLSLKYLNFSGNQKLEVKRDQNRGVRDTGERNLSDFTVLEDIRVLGLMDVTLTIPSVPDQTENCRVRTYGSSVLNMKYGMADSIGNHNNLSIMDMVVERFRGNEKEAILGLFDGRNASEEDGNKVSKLIQETFGTVFSEELSKLREGETTSDALRRAFLYTNKEIGNTTMLSTEEIAHSSIAHRSSTAANLNPQDRMTGSCATIVYLNDNKLYVANVGDSMAILTKSAFGEYTVLTTRHDPTTQEELARIRGGAGVVSATGKLDGILDVSRAIGFYNLIPHIHAAPSIFEYELTGSEDYLIVASKQLWEYVSYENAFDVARTQLHNPMLAAQKLRDFAIAYGCTDKIMVMVLAVGTRNKKPSLSRVGASNLVSGSGFTYQIPGYEDELFPSIKKRRDRSFLPEDSTLARLGSEVKPPTGDVAMVFTDIKNSTLLWETYPVAMRSAIKIHNDIMRRQILLMRGYEVKTEGDAFIVSFPTPTSALLWCFSVQQRLLVADWPAEILASEQGCEMLDDNGEIIFRGLSVRMGIHWGTPVSELDVITKRMDYFGPMVNRTARISAVADGGQITLSTDFLSEMKLLKNANEKVEKDGASLQEAFGTEIIGEAISKDISMLNNLGWVVKEIGEMKLKGLENPELISVTYPNNLEGRYAYHFAAREETPNPNGTLTAPPAQQSTQSAVSSPSVTKGGHDEKATATGTLSPTKRVGTLTFDLLVKLRGIADRLEKVCSQMNNADGMAVSRKHFSQYQRQSSRNLVAVVPSSDKDYVALFEHLVTRVENALSTLYIRAAVNQARGDDGGAYNAELADLLSTLATLLAK